MKYEWARTRRLSAALAVAAFVAAGCGKHESEHDAAAPREA
ncbi:efflux transporter periplasmic adaptor subunit, partial [Burkholderia pseudomallei]